MARRRAPDPPPTDCYWDLGIATPDVRRLAARFAKDYAALSQAKQLGLTAHLLDHGSDEAAHLGIFLLGKTIDRFDRSVLRALGQMVESFRGWSVTDAFCIEVLQSILRRDPDATIRTLEEWSTSSSRWKRRASVVVYARKIGASGEFTEQGLAACERLIWDTDDLVRKGVGWALKDLMKGEKAPVLRFVEELRRRGVSSTITLYAIRDFVGEERRRILSIRP